MQHFLRHPWLTAQIMVGRFFNPARRPFKGCCESLCVGRRDPYKHQRCSDCGRVTCCTGLKIEPHTLRRRYVPRCQDCKTEARFNPREKALRSERTRKDWSEVTTPIRGSAIETGVMTEQFPGKAREAIRAFADSGANFATVPDSGAADLQAAIAALGLADAMYAEQRGRTTVLRRAVRTRNGAELLPIRGRRPA